MVPNLIKSKFCLYNLTVLRNANKTIEIRTYKLQLLKSFLKKYMDNKKKLNGNFSFFEEEYFKKKFL